MHIHLTAFVLRVLRRVPPVRTERGDVPGWVLITIMTAGIVTVLWQFAGPQLTSMLQSALGSVSGGGGAAQP